MGGFSTFKRTRFLLVLFRWPPFPEVPRTDRPEIQCRREQSEEVHENEDLFQLLDLSKSLTYFTSALRTNRSVVDKSSASAPTPDTRAHQGPEEDEELLEDVKIEYDQAYEMVQMYKQYPPGHDGCFASIISNNLNIIMKFLAVVTIVLPSPPWCPVSGA